MQNCMSLLVYALCVVVSLKFSCGSIAEGYLNRSCIESEKQALLLFKGSLIDELNYLSSWIGNDCCAWHGIGCNNETGHVVQLDLRNGSLRGSQILPSLLELKRLSYLDLSLNKFHKVQIPEFFGSFKYLTYLNLSSTFRGLVPHHLGNVSRLQYLDLSYRLDTISPLSIDSMGWLSKLSLLEYLDLSYINLARASDWFPSINMLSNSFSVLKLYGCELSNYIPLHTPIINLTSLVSLDLGSNNLKSSFPSWVFNNTGLAHLNLRLNYYNASIPESIGCLTSLIDFDLSKNNFFGSIPNSIGNLTSLTNLDLHDNKFQGSIPKSIGNLAALSELDLSYNNFQGLISRSIGNLTSLSVLHLQGNILDGSLPLEIGNMTNLTSLSISGNGLSGPLPDSLCQMSKLEWLFASSTQLSGRIPTCIGELTNLRKLDLFHNSWDGILSEHHFVNLTRLTSLFISSTSNLVLNVSSKWVPPFQLEEIYTDSLQVGPEFPQWLLTQRHIRNFRMQNASISDTIPADWFGSVPLSKASVVDLSNNDINGEQLSLISLGSNHVHTLTLSNNRLSGEFPAFICNLTSLSILVLSNNNFSGKIPQCLGNLIGLTNLDLMSNSLSGDIPVSLGSLMFLENLNLHNNKFHGELPLSFQYLTSLVALNLGRNNMSGILPHWVGLGDLLHVPGWTHRLRYLILRSNNFYGNISTELCQHSSLQILNLGQNKLTGNIPPCFGNFSSMISCDVREDDLFLSKYFPTYRMDESQMIVDDAKGYELNYTSTLRFMVSIDLSSNNISGEIPKELMDLRSLSHLNLAGNHLAGRIPDRIGKLENLELLDLSRNELNGPIPQSLSDLNFLSHLNLSFNNLSGRIPTGNQLQTLDDPSIYAGNNQLCGRPILKSCTNDTESHNVHDYNETNSDSDDEHVWFYAGLGPGLLVGFLGFCGSLHFIKSWRYTFFQFVEKVFDKIALEVALLRRKLDN